MVKQYTESQYDDDLTLSNDAYDESYYSDADDLFEFSTDDDSPISRLKSLILSIDWEITDEVLLQFNEELLDLKGIWAGESINLVYIQALEKISKYIYQNKADSHPNAIKLLLTFYYNLEKIVSSQDLSEEQKKDILLEDVKKFENLKRQIKLKPSFVPPHEPERPPSQSQKMRTEASNEDQLLNLKAIVLGIDWEITDQDLNDLRREVIRLEEKFSKNRPKLILLQGIGTLAAYIKVKKSNAHPDAFKVMQLFYDSLEKIVQTPMSLEAEKIILFPAVEKFNSFKALLGPTISPESIIKKDDETAEHFGHENHAKEISPALADVSEEEAAGFQAEKEALALGLNDSGGVASHIENFFGESLSDQLFTEKITEEPKENKAGSAIIAFEEDELVVPVEKHLALQGIDVGNDDEGELEDAADVADEHIRPGFKEPSTTDAEIAGIVIEPPLIVKVAQQEEEQEALILPEEQIIRTIDTIFPVGSQEFPQSEQEHIVLDRENALKGVDVETDADDDSEELSLPMEGEELAPALAAMGEESLFSATTLDRAPTVSSVTEEIVGTIDGLFLDHDEISAKLDSGNLPEVTDVGIKNEEIVDEELIGFEDWLKEDNKEEEPSVVAVGSADDQEAEKETFVSDMPEMDLVPAEGETDGELAATHFIENKDVDNLASFFTDTDFGQNGKDSIEMDALVDSLETEFAEEKGEVSRAEMIDNTDTFFGAAEEPAGSGVEAVSGVFPEKREEGVIATSVSALFSEPQYAEDEVVFELFQEEVEADAEIRQESDKERELLVVGAGIDLHESRVSAYSGAAGNEIIEELADSSTIAVAERKRLEPFSDLQGCIDSLKIEISDTVIAGLFKEINALRQRWADKPLEKTFLQLLSTVIQHIDSYRYESSSEAYGLLVSICQAIYALKDDNLRDSLDVLLRETLKVLEWQQGMLSRQAVTTGNQLTFADPVRMEEGAYQSDVQRDFDDLLESYADAGADGISCPQDVHDETVTGIDLIPNSAKELVVNNELSVEGNVEFMLKAFADDLKKEIAALRQSLQTEIVELRRELIKD